MGFHGSGLQMAGFPGSGDDRAEKAYLKVHG